MKRHPTLAIYVAIQAGRLPFALYLICFAALIAILAVQVAHL